MTKQSVMPFNIGDWKKDPGVQTLNRYQKSIWLDMIFLMWESGQRGKLILNGEPMPWDALARILEMEVEEAKEVVDLLIQRGIAKVEDETGVVYCARIVRDEEKRVKAREYGKRGGNPNILNTLDKGVKGGVTQAGYPPSDEPSVPPLINNIYTEEKEKEKEDIDILERKEEGCGEREGKPSKSKVINQTDTLYQESFNIFWSLYPARNGKKIGKQLTFKRYIAIKKDELSLVNQAVKNYAASEMIRQGIGIKDPQRFLMGGLGQYKAEYWRDWITPEKPGSNGQPPRKGGLVL